MIKKSAGVFLLREERGEIFVLALVGRNSWDLPKGGIREKESPFQAAKRELLEETGISEVVWGFGDKEIAPFKVTYTLRNKTNKEVTFFVATTKKHKVFVSNEHLSYKWLPLPQAKESLPGRFHGLVDFFRELIFSG
jgi:8-oxo-dGTP pyrophosphatase MutT (NUDIX family)